MNDFFNKLSSVKKEVVCKSYNDGAKEYNVVFTTTTLYSVFGKTYTKKKIHTDRLIFSELEQAIDYMNNVDMPSKWIWHDGGDYGSPYYEVKLCGLIKEKEIKDTLVKHGHSKKFEIYFYPAWDNCSIKPPYSHIYDNKHFALKYDGCRDLYGNTVSVVIKKLIDKVSFSSTVVKSTIIIEKTQLDEDLEHLSSQRRAVIENEIKRVDRYKEHLQSLL